MGEFILIREIRYHFFSFVLLPFAPFVYRRSLPNEV
jgi:hypothetical protein